MNDDTNMNSGELVGGKRLDQVALRGVTAVAVALALIVGAMGYGAIAESVWMHRLLSNGWLMALVVGIIALVAIFAFDLTRPKNVAWRSLGEQFSQAFKEEPDRGSLAAGRGQIGNNWYFGIRCFASPDGLEINRMLSFVNPPLSIPWSAIAKIDTFPNLLTGREGFETDMQAQVNLRDHPSVAIEVPWLNDFRTFLPKAIRYRAIKLSKK